MNKLDNIVCREYTPDDYTEVEKVNTATLRVSFSYLYNIYYRKHPDLFLVAVDKESDKIIGFILVDINGGEMRKNSALVYGIGVLPDYRRQGIGKMLIYEIIKRLEKYPKIKELYLHVQQTNEGGLKFYTYLGFKFVKTITNFYSWGENAHQMSIKL
ncbi:MAG: GNAT family N-acetyltransferase [Candidatus Helarchaeota archaeon]